MAKTVRRISIYWELIIKPTLIAWIAVQKRFLSYVFLKFDYYNYIRFAPYVFKLDIINIGSLANRRTNVCRLFVFDILPGKIDSQKVLESLYINGPPISFRHYTFLNNRLHRTDYGLNEPISNMVYLFNEVYSNMFYNFESKYRHAFKKMVKTVN